MLISKRTIVSILMAGLILTLGIIINKLNLNVITLAEKEKCPACFGTSMCQAINSNKISFEFTNFYSYFNNLFSVKNVYYGKYNNKKVIMKKLAHKSELDYFDEKICTNSELSELCFSNKHGVKERKTNFYELIVKELDNSDMTDPNIKLRLCPTSTKINELLPGVTNLEKNKDYHKFLWTLIKINPEPIILQILSPKDNWPTPIYFGACGRLVIEEYIGLPLLAFNEEPWIRRIKIASSLLDAAYIFTFKHPKFAFYLTDLSMDNIAVNDQDKAIFVDLENIIIVDKNPSAEVLEKMEMWNTTYTNELDLDCQHCFAFSPIDICNHKISDHNYYAICQHILTEGLDTDVHLQGFLHSTPEYILEKYPLLTDLLKRCSKPDKHQSRIDIGIKLKRVLDKIIKDIK